MSISESSVNFDPRFRNFEIELKSMTKFKFSHFDISNFLPFFAKKKLNKVNRHKARLVEVSTQSRETTLKVVTKIVRRRGETGLSNGTKARRKITKLIGTRPG